VAAGSRNAVSRKAGAAVMGLSSSGGDFMSANITVTVDKSSSSLKGTTLYVEDKVAHPHPRSNGLDPGAAIPQTAIYVPDKHDTNKDLTVILWLHGQHVGNYRTNLFGPDTNGGVTNLRDSIDAAAKDVVLIVPFLGHSEGKTQPLTLPDTNKKGI